MRYLRLISNISLLLLTISTNVGAEVKTVVTVNGVNLAEADLNQEIRAILPFESTYHSGIAPDKAEAIRAKAMDTLIEKELKYQDALARGLKLSDAELNKELDKHKKRLARATDYEKVLESAGFTPATFARYVERRVLAETAYAEFVTAKVSVTDQTVKEFYEANKSRYLKPHEYRASHILVKVNPGALDDERADLKKRAASLLKQLKAGADFGELAERESDDMSGMKKGDLGYFHEGQTMPEFEAAVKALKVGEISDLVETLYGYHIIKLIDKKEPRQMPFEEIKDKLKTQLKSKEESRLQEQWLAGLKAKAKIEYPGKVVK